MSTFIIRDWAGNVCFEGKEFETFQEAWGFIYEHDPAPATNDELDNEHYYDDYFVVEKDEV